MDAKTLTHACPVTCSAHETCVVSERAGASASPFSMTTVLGGRGDHTAGRRASEAQLRKRWPRRGCMGPRMASPSCDGQTALPHRAVGALSPQSSAWDSISPKGTKVSSYCCQHRSLHHGCSPRSPGQGGRGTADSPALAGVRGASRATSVHAPPAQVRPVQFSMGTVAPRYGFFAASGSSARASDHAHTCGALLLCPLPSPGQEAAGPDVASALRGRQGHQCLLHGCPMTTPGKSGFDETRGRLC